MPQKPTILHKIPLTLVPKEDGTLDLTCEVVSIAVENSDDVLRLTHKPPQPKNAKHQYCYTIATPHPTEEYVYYVAVFSGPNAEELKPWPQEKGVSQSPVFDLCPGEVEHRVSAVVLGEPRVTRPEQTGVNSGPRPLAAPPQFLAARKHVKSDFQGGDDEL